MEVAASWGDGNSLALGIQKRYKQRDGIREKIALPGLHTCMLSGQGFTIKAVYGQPIPRLCRGMGWFMQVIFGLVMAQ